MEKFLSPYWEEKPHQLHKDCPLFHSHLCLEGQSQGFGLVLFKKFEARMSIGHLFEVAKSLRVETDDGASDCLHSFRE